MISSRTQLGSAVTFTATTFHEVFWKSCRGEILAVVTGSSPRELRLFLTSRIVVIWTRPSLSFSSCSSSPTPSSVWVHLCFFDSRAYQCISARICNSQLPPWHIVPISAYLYCSFFLCVCVCLFSSVHCFGQQLLYLLRLTGGLAVSLGFRTGNRQVEKGEDNRDRQGLDHTHIHPPTSATN